MTGKAKPTAAAKKPTAAAKKPTAAAKKPTAKFNLNKLIMLIGRNPQKKGKKMMGGYMNQTVNPIKDIILTFLNKIETRRRIKRYLHDYYNNTMVIYAKKFTTDHNNYVKNHFKTIYDSLDLNKQIMTHDEFIPFIQCMISSAGDEIDTLIDDPDIVDYRANKAAASNEIFRKFMNMNFMIIVKVLCKVYANFHNFAEDNNNNIDRSAILDPGGNPGPDVWGPPP